MKNMEVYLTGIITWVLTSKSPSPKFNPNEIFRALAKFSSDWKPSLTVVVNYSPYPLLRKNTYQVRLSFPFFDRAEVVTLSKSSDLIILDSYKVLAICKELKPTISIIHMGDIWENSE